MLIRGKVITTSGFSEKFLGVENTSIGVASRREPYRFRNQVEMLIRGKVITTSGFGGKNFKGRKHSYWSGESERDV